MDYLLISPAAEEQWAYEQNLRDFEKTSPRALSKIIESHNAFREKRKKFGFLKRGLYAAVDFAAGTFSRAEYRTAVEILDKKQTQPIRSS